MGDGCLRSEENETRRYEHKHMHAHMFTFTKSTTGTSSVRPPCDGQRWHLAGRTIRRRRGVGEREREKASSTLDREMKRGERNKRGECERSVPPGLWPGARLCGYLPLHCLLAENEAMC